MADCCSGPDKGGRDGQTSGEALRSDVLAELAAFNLATHTPMQAMTSIAGWQEILRSREGTG
jgi:hypothetical protein